MLWTADLALSVDSIAWTADGFVPTPPPNTVIRYARTIQRVFRVGKQTRLLNTDRSLLQVPK